MAVDSNPTKKDAGNVNAKPKPGSSMSVTDPSTELPKEQSFDEQQTSSMYLKTGRLSKGSIRSHMSKRYKKVITDKVM